MDEASMEPEGSVRNTKMGQMRAEVVIKDDGRYLIYYSWPDDGSQAEREPNAGRAVAAPAQEAWAPETNPSDV
jgi:hypothetical protein